MVELQAEERDEQRWLFDPIGLLLVGIVGAVGFLSLVRHSWVLGVPCVVLATLGIVASHRHFDPASDAGANQRI
jgi:hypothetical protein